MTAYLEGVRTDRFPIAAMPGEKVVFKCRAVINSTRADYGACSISVRDASAQTALNWSKCAQAGSEFSYAYTVPQGRPAGNWVASANWTGNSVSLFQVCLFTVAAPSFALHSISCSSGTGTANISGAVQGDTGSPGDYGVSAVVFGKGREFPRRAQAALLATANFTASWSFSPSPFAFPGEDVSVSVIYKNLRKSLAQQNISVSLKVPLTVALDSSTQKKTSLSVCSAQASILAPPGGTVSMGLLLRVPTSHQTGSSGIFPLRYAACAVILEVANATDRMSSQGNLTIFPPVLKGRGIWQWSNLTLSQSGVLQAGLKVPGSNFSLLLLGKKPSGEFFAYDREFQMTQPLIGAFSCEAIKGECRVSAVVESPNRIASALFQYSPNGSDWKNIMLDLDESDGFAAAWNTTDLSPGDYLLRLTVTDELGLQAVREISFSLRRPVPLDARAYFIASLIMAFAAAGAAIASARVRERSRRERMERRSIASIEHLEGEKAYRYAVLEAYDFLMRLSRHYEGFGLDPSWTKSDIKKALNREGLLTHRVSFLIDSYFKARFGAEKTEMWEADDAVRALKLYRGRLYRRAERRKIEGNYICPA